MTKRSVALVGVLIVMAMIGSSVIGAVSAIAASDSANGSFSVFLPLIMNAIGAMAEVPQGAVMTFNLASCPSGWSEVTDAQGKALVGLPSGGTLGGIVGTSLSDLENRNHSHNVNPTPFNGSSSGIHSHIVDAPGSGVRTDPVGGHRHNLDGTVLTDIDQHHHEWAKFSTATTGQWKTWESDYSEISIMTWGDGMDSAGSGHYPLSRSTLEWKHYYTDEDSHLHTVDLTDEYTLYAGGHDHGVPIPTFSTEDSTSHQHSIDVPNTPSTTASTTDVMPYIQFLVCEKD